MSKANTKENQPTIIKKYANRRLYDTGRSSYVTLDDLCEMVKEGHDFVVQDAKSGTDITRTVLAQIILDQEAKGEGDGTLLPTNFMKQLIGFYGGNMEDHVPNYLGATMDIFSKNQERMQEQMNKGLQGMTSMQSSMGNIFPTNSILEEMNKQNVAMIERTMDIFNPFRQSDKE